MPTKVIDNFKGSMTLYQNGDINSGFSYVVNTFGNDPFTKPGNLTWCNDSTRIDPTGSVITDLIMAAKERVENGILYVYAIGHLGRFYKIQVNDPTTYNPDYDNPVLLTTLAINSPTFTRGGSITFYGSTEKVFIGHDKGATKVNFDGTGETFVGALGSWTQTVPRPVEQFVGKLYYGNGSNLAEVDSTETVTTYAKLSPSFPNGTQTRDVDTSSDGNYLNVVVSRLPLPDITSATQDTTTTASSDSFIFKWNGVDAGATSSNSFPSFSIGANIMFQNYQYTFGYDNSGGGVFAPLEKILSLQEVVSPLPNAISSSGNLVRWMSPLSYGGFLEADFLVFGSLDFEVGRGYWDLFGQLATGTETDVIQVPLCLPVSNFGAGASNNGYPSTIFGDSKMYFSTLETSSAPTTKYKFYKWSPPSSTLAPSNPLVGAVYQTQTQLFSKKMQIKEIRIYTEPWPDGASFSIDLIGSSGAAMSGGSKTFVSGAATADGVIAIGADYAWYTPQTAPTYALGLLITNLGSVNHTISKIEFDYFEGGK